MNLMLRLIQGAIDMKLMISWAVTSSALILIVLAVRYLFRKKLSARLRYALWGIVLLRLLVPFQVELPAAAPVPVLASNLAQDVTPRLEDTMLYAIPTEEQPYGLPAGTPPQYARNGPYDNWEYYSGGVVYNGERVTRYAFMLTALEVLVLIWIAGTALTALVILLSNLRFSRRLRKRRVLAGGHRPPLQDAPIPVYTAEGLPSPCLFGVFRPAVYVTPGAAEDPDTLRHVLAHELTHYAHRDHLWSLLRCLALALHWYNPLVWLAVVLSKEDGELACDEGAVARLGEAERIPYGRTLVDMVAARSLRPADLLSCSTAMTGGGKSVKRRVAQIVKKPETVKAALFAVIALVALSAIFVFAGRAQPQPSPTFLSQLDQATAIRYIPTVLSSGNYPVPITDEDLLAQAKERLSTFTYLSEDEPYPDLSGLGPHRNPKIVLTCGEQETVYTLMWQNNYTYLFPGDLWEQQEELRKEEGETAQLQGVSGTMRSRPGDRVFSAVSELALLQIGKTGKNMITPGDTPELEEFFAQLEGAQSIFVGQPMLSSANPPGLISDPVALARAKELLGKASPPIQLPEGVTREEFWESIRPFLSSTEYQDMEEMPTITQDDLEDMLFMRGNPILLCPGPEVTPDLEYRYWLADNNLLQWDAELEENPIKLLATFSEDVYSQLAELARSEEQSSLLGDLTQEQVDRANEAFAEFVEVSPGGYASSEISCFFTSNYDDPTQIDLEEFLRYCPIGTGDGDCLGEEDTEEFLAVMAQDNSWVDPERELHSPYDLPVPVHRYPRAEVSALLQKYAGVTVEELDWDGCLYVKEYDAFYNFTSDAGPGFFPCAGGQIMEDSVLLWSKPDENGDRCELVLRKDGSRWLIQSHHTIYER